MDLSPVAGVFRPASVVGVLVGIAVVVLARLLARRSSPTDRTIVSLTSDRS